MFKVPKQKRKSDIRNVFAGPGHASIRKSSGLLTSPANELPRQPLSTLQRPSKNTLACKLINVFSSSLK